MGEPTPNFIDHAAERCGHNYPPRECPHEHCGYREALIELESARHLLDLYCDAPLKAELRECKIAELEAEIERLRVLADLEAREQRAVQSCPQCGWYAAVDRDVDTACAVKGGTMTRELSAENARLRAIPNKQAEVIWVDDATPFNAQQVRELLRENERLRKSESMLLVAIREAEQRGAERMREACANAAEHSTIWAVGLRIAASIRALPLDDPSVETR